MPNQTIAVPTKQQKTIACLSCQTPLRFALITNICPHLYCSLCHIVFPDTKLYYDNGTINLYQFA